jgi:pyrimidine operon attenuation protein/uracil phosphoribosyltransferase
MENTELPTAEEIEQKLTRMAYEIAERHYNEKNIVFIRIVELVVIKLNGKFY